MDTKELTINILDFSFFLCVMRMFVFQKKPKVVQNVFSPMRKKNESRVVEGCEEKKSNSTSAKRIFIFDIESENFSAGFPFRSSTALPRHLAG